MKQRNNSIKENKQINDISHTSYTSGSSTSRHQSPLILRSGTTGLEEAVSSFGEKITDQLGNNSSPSPDIKQRERQGTIGKILESQNKLQITPDTKHDDMNVTQKKVKESLNKSLNAGVKSKRKRNYFDDFTINIMGDDTEKKPGNTETDTNQNDKRSRHIEADKA